MKTCKLLKYDIRQGFRGFHLKMLGLILIVLVSCIELYSRKNNGYSMSGEQYRKATYMDYLFFLLGGMKEYHPGAGMVFIFPIKWLILHLYLIYTTLYYPYKDLFLSMGDVILVRGKSRRSWWRAKCVWNILFIVLAYMVIFATTGIFCLVGGEVFSMDITPEIIEEFMNLEECKVAYSLSLSVYTVFVPLFISMSISIFQMLLSLLVKPVFGFGIVSMILLTSAYIVNPFLIGNYAMPMRSTYVVESGFGIVQGILAALCLLLISIIVGEMIFRKYDILQIAEM